MTHFKIYRYTLPYQIPFQERTGFLLHLFHCQKEGWGEIAPFPGRSRETPAQALEQLLCVLSNSKFVLDEIRLRKSKAKCPIALFPSVAFGLFSALNDQTIRKTLPLCALLTGSLEEIVTKAEIAFQQGYVSAKIKISHLPLKTIEELVSFLGKRFTLRLDANRAFSFKDAMQWGRCFKSGVLEYIEEPTFELDKLDSIPYPFALDESLLELNELPTTPHFKTIIFKPSVMGGYKECLMWAKKKRIVFSSACETGIGILGIAGLASLIPIQASALGVDTYRFLSRDILSSPLDFSSGIFSWPQKVNIDTHMLQEIAYG